MKTKNNFLYYILTLLLTGIVFISISSLTEASSTLGDKFYFIKKQIIWLFLSLIAFFVGKKINITYLKKHATSIFYISIALLVIVLLPQLSNQALGARRWLNLGFIGIQPSEILKFSSVLFFASIFSLESKRNIKNLVIYLVIPFTLILLEPNLSTAILVASISISIFYLSGGDINSILVICLSAIIIFFILIFISPYRFSRFKTFMDPNSNTTSTSYHSNQIILAISSGGFMGKGFANSDQKYKFLPKISTDSILAVIGEETGFIGISLILILYVFIIISLFKMSSSLANQFESLFVAGISCWISYQTLINISAIVALIPLTGVPLPFVSYGGSSLISLAFSIGIIRNIQNSNEKLLYLETDEKNNHNRHSSYSSPRAHLSAPKRH